MATTFTSLIIVEMVLTGVAVLMFLYRGMLDLKEEDHLVLDGAEAHLVREQETIRRKVTLLNRYLKAIGVTWGVFLIAILGVWIVHGLYL